MTTFLLFAGWCAGYLTGVAVLIFIDREARK